MSQRTWFSLLLTLAIVANVAVGDIRFLHDKKDANGLYLWSEPANWSSGRVPSAGEAVEIGEDTAGGPRNCVVAGEAHCGKLELAEHAKTQGSTLWIQRNASLTVHGGLITLSKDRASRTVVDGTLLHRTTSKTLRVGGPWGQPDGNQPSDGRLIINPSGRVECWFLGINTNHTAEGVPSAAWPRNASSTSHSTDSQVVLNGGELMALGGIRMSTTRARRPGKLIIKGGSTVRMSQKSQYGFDFWCGVIEIHGGDADIQIDDLEVWGNKFSQEINLAQDVPVGWGFSVFKFVGKAVSTIRVTGPASFIDAALVDVSELRVPDGRYRIFHALSFKERNLAFAPGTDLAVWSIEFDDANRDLYVVKAAARLGVRVNAGPDTGTMFPVKKVSLHGAAFGARNTNLQWSQVSGPAKAKFAQTSQAKTSVVLPKTGTYVFRLTAKAGRNQAQDEVTVTVTESLVNRPIKTLFQAIAANEDGEFLWNDARNWDKRVPTDIDRAYIGANKKTVQAVVRNDGQCDQLYVAMDSDESVLTVKSGTLSVEGLTRIGNDSIGHLRVEGGQFVITDRGSFNTLCIGDGGVGSAGSSLVMTDGRIQLYGGMRVGLFYVGQGIEKSAGCLAEITGGTFSSQRWIRVGSVDPTRPGVLRIGGSADVSAGPDSQIRDGIMEVVGGGAKIKFATLDFTKNTSLLKFSGNGVSTIKAKMVSFAYGSRIDTTELLAPAGLYTLVRADAIINGGVKLTAESIAAGWKLNVTATQIQLVRTK